MRSLFLSLLLALVILGCGAGNSEVAEKEIFPKGYQLENHLEIKLPAELKEVSGITWMENSIWAIDDEYGDLFQLDPKTGELENRVKFGKDEDYEDLVILGDTAWVLRSNGDLYRVLNFQEGNSETEVFEFGKKGERDFETLLKKPGENSLLIICKNCEWDKKGESSVYEFDISKGQFEEKSLLTLQFGQVAGKESAFPNKKPTMEPSAAAIHPITGDVFILSSAGKWLMVASPSLEPKTIFPLNPSLFSQPEGLTFDNAGNLYVSNEAKNKPANFLAFPYSR